ncbi:hypothetical protein JW906_03730 [bacterium]|nr:hypothetical protein [bacterium]
MLIEAFALRGIMVSPFQYS